MTYSTDKKQHTQNTKMMGLNAHTGLRAGWGWTLEDWKKFFNSFNPVSNNATPEQQSPSSTSSDTSKTQS